MKNKASHGPDPAELQQEVRHRLSKRAWQAAQHERQVLEQREEIEELSERFRKQLQALTLEHHNHLQTKAERDRLERTLRDTKKELREVKSELARMRRARDQAERELRTERDEAQRRIEQVKRANEEALRQERHELRCVEDRHQSDLSELKRDHERALRVLKRKAETGGIASFAAGYLTKGMLPGFLRGALELIKGNVEGKATLASKASGASSTSVSAPAQPHPGAAPSPVASAAASAAPGPAVTSALPSDVKQYLAKMQPYLPTPDSSDEGAADE